MATFTKKDARELGMPLPLLNKWKTVMDELWCFFSSYKIRNKVVSLSAVDNVILFQNNNGHKYQIGVNFYNQKYLSLFVKIEGNDDFEAMINNIDEFGREGIIRTVAAIVTYAENVK